MSKSEWLKLWDHVLSNEPSFLFMAIVAYNAVCKNAIKSLKDAEEVEVISVGLVFEAFSTLSLIKNFRSSFTVQIQLI